MKRTRTILDGEKVKIAAIKARKNLKQVNEEAGLSQNYIYGILDQENVLLSTVSAVANALGLTALDILTVVPAEEDASYTQVDALAGVAA